VDFRYTTIIYSIDFYLFTVVSTFHRTIATWRVLVRKLLSLVNTVTVKLHIYKVFMPTCRRSQYLLQDGIETVCIANFRHIYDMLFMILWWYLLGIKFSYHKNTRWCVITTITNYLVAVAHKTIFFQLEDRTYILSNVKTR